MRGGDYSKKRARTLRRGLTPTVTHAIPYMPVRKGAIRRELKAFVAHGHCATGFLPPIHSEFGGFRTSKRIYIVVLYHNR